MSDLRWWVEYGDAAEALKVLPDGSIDALVTDPPAGIGFMGKEWDGSKGGRDKWIAWLAGILAECRRAMKPGAYGWVWALPRTAHWTATACEDAGFAVRDVLVHVFGTGFPKSRSLLKPAAEHWILIKAPGELRELRIEENRIGTESTCRINTAEMGYGGGNLAKIYKTGSEGRWPANFALSHSDDCADTCADDCAVKVLDEQSEGKMHSAGAARDGSTAIVADTYAASGYRLPPNRNMRRLGDSGGASRFFYQAKPSTKERSQGLADGARNTHTTVKSISLMRHLVSLIAAPGATILDPFTGSGSTGIAALAEGCHFVGIEREAEYVEIARQRIAAEAAKAR
jgi:site-specific DNA-methyltransferase (adenine-specific)